MIEWVRGNLVISNGDISLGDIVFSDGDLIWSLGDIFVMLRNRISPFDFVSPFENHITNLFLYHHLIITIWDITIWPPTDRMTFLESEKEYAWKSEFMEKAGQKMQWYLFYDVMKCGIIGYGVWKTYKTNGAWLQTNINFLTEKLSNLK